MAKKLDKRQPSSSEWRWENFTSIVEESISCQFMPTCQPGCQTTEASSVKSVVDALSLYIPPSFIHTFVEQTNLHAHQVHSSPNPPNSPWKDVLVEEMMAFLGMNVAMGVVIPGFTP